MNLILFINHIGGVSQKKKNYIGSSSKKKNYIGSPLVIFVKEIFIINLKNIIWETIDWDIYGIFAQEICNSTGTLYISKFSYFDNNI